MHTATDNITANFSSIYRHLFAPDIDVTVYPAHVVLKSTQNTVIEAFWRWFVEKMGMNLKSYIMKGRVEHLFDPQISFHP